MAFPATYNFRYYRGDTLEFRLYPKDNSGAPFNLEDYEVTFTISTSRGSAALENAVVAYSAIADATSLICAIRPEDSLALPTATSYVYDVEIRKVDNQPYPLVYTILTGIITVEEQITDVELEPTLQPPGQPTALTQVGATSSTISVTWDAPTTGGAPSAYIVGYSLATNPLVPVFSQTVLASVEEYEFIDLSPATGYVIGVAAINDATVGTPTPTTLLAATLEA